jgi:hypothetical protein
MKALRESNLEYKSRIVACPCGKQIEHRTGRRPRFCSARCKEKARTRVRKAGLAPDTRAPAKLRKRNSNSRYLRDTQKLSTWRVLGPAHVIAAELWDRHSWEPAVSSGGTRIEIGRLRSRALVS